MPQCAGLDRYALLGQSFAQFGQGKIGLGCDPGAQHRLHLSHPGTAMAADLKTGAPPRLLLPVAYLDMVTGAN